MKDYTCELVLVFFLGLVLGAAALFAIIQTHGTQVALREQAVERGFARWQIIDPATGKTEFRWNEGKSDDT